MIQDAALEDADEAFADKAEAKARACEERTRRNAEKRKRKRARNGGGAEKPGDGGGGGDADGGGESPVSDSEFSYVPEAQQAAPAVAITNDGSFLEQVGSCAVFTAPVQWLTSYDLSGQPV